MNNDFRVGMEFQVTETQNGKVIAHHYIEPYEGKQKIFGYD